MSIQNVEEDIAQWLEDYYPKHNITDSGWPILPEIAKENYKQDANQFLNLTYNGFTLRQALETILTIKEGECLAKVDAFNGEATLMVYPSPVKDL